MDIIQWYAIAMAALMVLLLFWLWLSSRFHDHPRLGAQTSQQSEYHQQSYFPILRWFYNRLYIWVTRHFTYALCVHRRYWTSITRMQAALILLYLIGNGFCMGWEVNNLSELMKRSGSIASVNIIPLFLGGRRSFVAGRLGIPLHIHYLAHHCIGRIVILQGVLHAILAVTVHQPWTFDVRTISGISVGSLLVLTLIMSMHFIRRSTFEIFLITHLWLALASISTLVWHALPGSLWIIISLSSAFILWACTLLLRLFQTHLNMTRHIWARVETFPNSPDLKLRIRLKRSLSFKPGQYFYIQFCSLDFPYSSQSHPFVVTWLDESSNELQFLIQPQNGLTRKLRNNKKSLVTLSGPYGQCLYLNRYENVLLFAQGIGISGLLPYVQQLSERKNPKHALTKRVNFYWFLEDNCQIEWVEEYFEALKKYKDILAIQVYFPEKFTRPKWQDKHFQCFHQEPSISSYIEDEASRDGRKFVATCGNADFTLEVRQTVIKATSEKMIEFAEVEYRPLQPPIHPRLQTVYTEDLENIGNEAISRRRLQKPHISSPLATSVHNIVY